MGTKEVLGQAILLAQRGQPDKAREMFNLVLVAEPHNPYDPYAVRIQWRGVKIGYVPRQVSEEVAKLIAQGRNLRPTIRDKNPRRPFSYHSLTFQLDLPMGYQLWKWPM